MIVGDIRCVYYSRRFSLLSPELQRSVTPTLTRYSVVCRDLRVACYTDGDVLPPECSTYQYSGKVLLSILYASPTDNYALLFVVSPKGSGRSLKSTSKIRNARGGFRW